LRHRAIRSDGSAVSLVVLTAFVNGDLVKRTSSRIVLGLASVALLVGAAACGDDDDSTSATTAPAAAAAPTTAAAAAATTAAPETTAAPATTAASSATTVANPYAPPASGGATATTAAGAAATGGAVSVADSSLGKILVDGNGMTLYAFTPDNKGPSTCTDKCLAAWPSLAGPATAGTGVDASKLGTATRPDNGQAQATYGGWPLYTFIQDSKPGDVNGQDSGGKWYVVGADGNMIED
jgi:predicted lipoprotein with Yx(FWY)xxD motif